MRLLQLYIGKTVIINIIIALIVLLGLVSTLFIYIVEVEPDG